MNNPFAPEPEPDEQEAQSIARLLDWILEGYMSINELANDAGVSVSTLRRMQRGFVTERTMGKLQPIIDDIIHDEQQEAMPYWRLI